MEKKKILMLAETRGTADYVSLQLQEIFDPFATVEVVIADPQLPPLSLNAPLVVILSKVLEDQMQAYIKPGARVLIADRMVDPREVGRLYDIPEGADVLVVNTSPKVTAESIGQLRASGVDDLRYHAYYPGIGDYPKDCHYVVTFGESQLIPPGDYRQVLDLRSRPVGISTCVLIAQTLGVYDAMREVLSSLYLHPLIRMTHDLAASNARNQQISADLQNIINLFSDGLLVLDQERQIIFCNQIARRILQIREGTSPLLADIVSQHPITQPFFHELRGENYYFEPIHSQIYREKSTILTISDVKKISNIENSYRHSLTEKGLVAKYTFDDIVYHSPAMGAVVEMAKEFAKGDSTIFIHGESGSGKELLAQAIHNGSRRRGEAFVAVNFASISSSLSESELFGYAEGAFTGAKRGGKPGLFELAHRGTLFLDEIGDAPLELQKKLLRVIQERKVLPVGGNKMIPIDVRIVAASNQSMTERIAARQFREDLYYRLNVLPLYVPPLRQRQEDILGLFLYFLRNEFCIQTEGLEPATKRALECHPWNGNVRELHNVAEYVSNFARWDPHWELRIRSVLCPQSAAQPEGISALQAKLEERSDLRRIYRILELLDRPPYRWSRHGLAAALQEQEGTAPSDSQLKRSLTFLKEQGLIGAVTGSGTFLKEKGRLFLAQKKP